MSSFQIPVEHYMTTPAHTVSPEDDLSSVHTRLAALNVSSLAVVESGTKFVGVISMTDLIRIGRRQAGSRGKSALLTLPDDRVAKHMQSAVVTVSPDESIAAAAKRMVDGHFHRVYVEKADSLVGVLSTRDIMLAIRDKRTASPIDAWMSSPAFTVRAEEPISLATQRLEKAHVTGLIVVEDGWPIGLFTQEEALDSRNLPRDTPVERAMSSAMLALETQTALHRAAAQAAAMQARRVIAVHSREVVGILTGFDFARAAM